ncbi:unnamed protein product [Didymodactylos carnosus]|uniref:Uncharacterized protein n=1 Tax=Didymodactylos carnosus TaxID=1234261 RepID=A0A815Y4M0_9BILA|nr:unnamed protein product [Didymodactylos carnosus]CAF4427938.1 unnamed protein product [Didymodactylos carnosus]
MANSSPRSWPDAVQVSETPEVDGNHEREEKNLYGVLPERQDLFERPTGQGSEGSLFPVGTAAFRRRLVVLPARRRARAQGIRGHPRQLPRFHQSQPSLAESHRRMATKFSGLEPVGLLNLEHFGRKSMREAPPDCRIVEARIDQGLGLNQW